MSQIIPYFIFEYFREFFLLTVFGFSFSMIFVIIQGRSEDLVEERRRLRVPFSIGLGVVILLAISVGLFTQILTSPSEEEIFTYYLFAWNLDLFLLFIFTLSINLLTAIRSIDAVVPLIPIRDKEYRSERESLVDHFVTPETIETIRAYMIAHKPYEQAEVKINTLSKEMSIPVHRLRKAINKGMGYTVTRQNI